MFDVLPMLASGEDDRASSSPGRIAHRGDSRLRPSLIAVLTTLPSGYVFDNPPERVGSPKTMVCGAAEALCRGFEIRQLVSGGDSGDEGTRGGFDAGIADKT
jgi:hypothetical protein